MSFGINTRSIKCLEDYAKARTFAMCAEKFKGSCAVPLDRGSTGMKKKHMSACFDPSTEAVDCYLYNTTMATYHPDGSIVIHEPKSVSDGRFLNAVLPGCIHTSNSRLRLGRNWDDMKVYRFSSNKRNHYERASIAVRLGEEGCWEVIDPEGDTETWDKYTIDRKIAKSAWTYDKEQAAFMETLPMIQEMARRAGLKTWCERRNRDEVLAMLLDESQWAKLGTYLMTYPADLKQLRLRIIGAAGGIKCTSVPFIPSTRERSWDSSGLGAYYNAYARATS